MNEHLKARNTTYWPHFKFAFGAGLTLVTAGVISIIHSIFPNFMPSYAERKTLALARLARMKNAKQYHTHSKQ
jgi:hypothetical protein